MHKMRISYLAVISALSLAACGEQGAVTGPTGPTSRARNNDVVNIAPGGSATICSNAGTVVSRNGGAFAPVFVTAGIPSQWHAPVSGSVWVVPFDGAQSNAPNFEIDTYETSFSVPANNTAVISSGSSYADNQVLSVKVDNAGTSLGGNASLNDAANYGTTALNWSTSGTIAAGTHMWDVRVENNDSVQPTDPTGVTFCYTVTATPIASPPVVALFVIGDEEAHALHDNVNFWGAQWWKNNSMSGEVSKGVAAFKGYATSSTNVCGGTWVSLPGNSSNPPDVIPSSIVIIVTSTVHKNGNDISGNIVQLLRVNVAPGYAGNPGHEGNGTVTQVLCP
jgi:hypothetical protein